jgi:hypothetical protein
MMREDTPRIIHSPDECISCRKAQEEHEALLPPPEPKFKKGDTVWAIQRSWEGRRGKLFDEHGEMFYTIDYIPKKTVIHQVGNPVLLYRLNTVSWWNREEDVFTTYEDCAARAAALREKDIERLTKVAKNTIAHIQSLLDRNFQ